MPSSRSAKFARVTLAAAFAAAGAITATALTATTAQAASSVGGQISRDEVLARANDWYNRNVPYDQNASATDVAGRYYRTDCSGFVSMAWHLSSSENTDSLDVRSLTTRIALTDLQPGDALDNDPHDGYSPDSAHIVLFDHWVNKSAGSFAYIAEASISTDMQKGTANINSGNIGSHPASGYFGLRYNKIVGGQAEQRGTLYHEVRGVAGVWSGFAAVGGYDGASSFTASQEAITSTPDGSTQTLASGTDGNLYHTARYANGTWTGWAPVDGFDGAARFSATSFSIAGMPNGDAQVLAVGKDGGIYHNIRLANGSWQGWARVGDWGARKVAITAMPNGDAQVLIIGNDGLIYHNVRFANGAWQGWNGVTGVGSAASFAASSISIAGMPDGDAQMVAVGNDGNVYHNNRLADGSWQGWAPVDGMGGATSFAASSVGISGTPNGDAQIVAVGNDGNAYHDARFANGSWQGWNSLGFGAVNVAITGLTDGSAQVLATHS